MNFAYELNKYMELLDCSATDLCKKTNLSPTIISRYLNGKRTPRTNSEYFNKIVEGLLEIAKQKDIVLKEEYLLNSLTLSIEEENINYDDFVNNFNSLMIELKINNADFAKALGYDTSFISKIKNKSRKPSDLESFIKQISNYIVNTYKSDEKKQTVASLINCSIKDFNNIETYKNKVIEWISTPHEDNNKSIKTFLTKLDKFNLNDYISTDFNKTKIPTAPIILRNSKTYYGKER